MRTAGEKPAFPGGRGHGAGRRSGDHEARRDGHGLGPVTSGPVNAGEGKGWVEGLPTSSTRPTPSSMCGLCLSARMVVSMINGGLRELRVRRCGDVK